MGREVRMVPADWQHPKYPDDHYEPRMAGRYVPLLKGAFADRDREWSDEHAKWQEGLVRAYGDEGPWRKRTPDDGPLYSLYAGARPSPDDYMPEWTAEEANHLMMYEDTSEGTPISPAFPTPELLARWLADNGASAFGDMTASYEDWLAMARCGWAPSIVVSGGVVVSGVAAISDGKSQ